MSNIAFYEYTTISFSIDGYLDHFHFLVFVSSAAKNIWTFVQIMLIIANGFVDCFHFWAIMNNAAMSIHVQIFVWAYVFNSLVYISRSGNAGSYNNSMINFLRNCQTIPQRLYHFTFPSEMHEGSNLSTSSLAVVIFSLCVFF